MRAEGKGIAMVLVVGMLLGAGVVALVQHFMPTKPAVTFEEGTTPRGSWCAFLTHKDSGNVSITCDFSQTNRNPQQVQPQ